MTASDPDAAANPAVSVIIPAYGVSVYIAEAIDSVLAQTFTDYEIIVVNDGCPDTTALERVLEPYRQRVVYVRKENGGLASARNAGIRVARAPLVALLDGDDAWTPDYLEVQVGMLRDDPSIDVVYPNGVIFGDTPLAGRRLMDLSPSRGAVTFESLVALRCVVTVSVTARKSMFLRVGGFDESLRRVEDFDLWLRIAKAGGRFVYHQRPLLRYRRRETSLSANAVAMRRAGVQVLENALRTLPLTPDERQAAEQAKRRFEEDIPYLAGRAALRRGDAATALEAFRELARIRWTMKNALRIALIRIAPRTALRLARRGEDQTGAASSR